MCHDNMIDPYSTSGLAFDKYALIADIPQSFQPRAGVGGGGAVLAN